MDSSGGGTYSHMAIYKTGEEKVKSRTIDALRSPVTRRGRAKPNSAGLAPLPPATSLANHGVGTLIAPFLAVNVPVIVTACVPETVTALADTVKLPLISSALDDVIVSVPDVLT